ncbi:hypothetical protein Trydic_g13860 [Trypoxylus dichotomus]
MPTIDRAEDYQKKYDWCRLATRNYSLLEAGKYCIGSPLFGSNAVYEFCGYGVSKLCNSQQLNVESELMEVEKSRD